MSIETVAAPARMEGKQVFLIGALCLVAGLAGGFAARGFRMPASTRMPAAAAAKMSPHAASGGRVLTLADMKQAADRQAAPLLEKLKGDPNNAALLAQVGAIYHGTHQFEKAAMYYRRAVTADPKNVALRTKLAASLYRGGDTDAALAQLAEARKLDAKDANTLFNIGMIEWQGKGDAKAALAAWQRLLTTNPQLSAERKATVQQLMAEAQATLAHPVGVEGAQR